MQPMSAHIIRCASASASADHYPCLDVSADHPQCLEVSTDHPQSCADDWTG